jgi:hypothetical protein
LNPIGGKATVLLEGRQFLWISWLLFVGTGQPEIQKETPMTSKHPKEQAKTAGAPARPQRADELDARDLDKVTGGLKKSGGPKSSGVISDPCSGGE